MEKYDIGLIGLGVMGQNLVLNMERNGYTIAVYNRTKSKTKMFIKDRGKEKYIKGFFSIKEFTENLKSPRKIFLMVKAGSGVDQVISNLEPFISSDDIIIDGGNSYFMDTNRRSIASRKKNYHFMGIGISGGEEGALKGPSMMPGGSKYGWETMQDILYTISAKAKQEPCCSYMGPDGAGHYVKMVHNGIEYADMQLIAESYFFLKKMLCLKSVELSEIFSNWQESELNSYLIQITGEILTSVDSKTGQPIIDLIYDRASQKGTGKWTSKNALELGVPTSIISESVQARFLSAMKNERVNASKILHGPLPHYSDNKNRLIETTRNALYAAKLCSYAQGFSLLKTASLQYDWDLNPELIASIWRNGCIIRAKALDRIIDAFQKNNKLDNLLVDPYFTFILDNNQDDWRYLVALAIENGIPIPAFSAALAYFDGYRSLELPANLIQAQREYFGAHGFERVDKEKNELHHHKFK